MSDASAPLQKAWFELVSAAVSPIPVYDHVPQDKPPAFVAIGIDSAGPSETKSANSAEHYLESNIYSSRRGFTEAKTIMGQIYAAAHKKPLIVDGFEATAPLFDFSDTFSEPDGVRCVIRFRTQTQ